MTPVRRILVALAAVLAASAMLGVLFWPEDAPRPQKPAAVLPPADPASNADPEGLAVARDFTELWALAITRGMSDEQLARGLELVDRPELGEAIAPPDHAEGDGADDQEHGHVEPDPSLPDGREALRIEVRAAQDGQVVVRGTARDSDGKTQQIQITTALTDQGWRVVEVDDPSYRVAPAPGASA